MTDKQIIGASAIGVVVLVLICAYVVVRLAARPTIVATPTVLSASSPAMPATVPVEPLKETSWLRQSLAVSYLRRSAAARTSIGLGEQQRGAHQTSSVTQRQDAHAALDAADLAAYGFGAKKDVLAQLPELSLTVAGREKQGLSVTAPGRTAEPCKPGEGW